MPKKRVYEIAAPLDKFYVDPFLVDIGMYKNLEEAQKDEAESLLVIAHHNKGLAKELLDGGFIRKIS